MISAGDGKTHPKVGDTVQMHCKIRVYNLQMLELLPMEQSLIHLEIVESLLLQRLVSVK